MKLILNLLFLIVIFSGCSSPQILETDNMNDSISTYYELLNDSVTLSAPQPIGKIVYVEHKQKIDILLQYIFPIVTLIIGVALDRIIIIYEKKKKIVRAGKRWFSEVGLLKGPLQKQISSYKKFIKSYCDDDLAFNIPNITIYNSLECKIFDTLKREELYDYVEMKDQTNSTTIFHKVINIIDITKLSYNHFKQSVEKSNQSISNHIEKFNHNLQKYEHEVNKQKYRSMLGEDIEYIDFLTNTEIKEKQPNLNLFVLQTAFLEKVINTM